VEVGAGFGIFCEEAKKFGKFSNIVAIEPNEDLARSCRSLGIEVVSDSIENIKSLRIAPDVIACFEVVEHLFSPKDFLECCKNISVPGSIIVITCPNYKGFDIQALGERSDSIDAEHINMFNPASLSLLLNRCGFELLDFMTPGELDAEILRSKVLSGEYRIEGQPFLRAILIDRWQELGGPFQKFLNTHKLSSHLWMVAQRQRL
jgi:hypothetical protein